MLDASHVDAAVPLAPEASASSLSRAASRAMVPLFALTLFLSSFLMFAVEPMTARQMLPILGGVPMVWNGCVVFFQTALLFGYGGAHVLTRWLPAPSRLLLYSGLAVLPLIALRLSVDASSARAATDAPLAWLLVALVTTVGPAFLVLAVSASVLQGALASTSLSSGRDPYFLYVASNAGSLAALVAYPTVIENWLGLGQQARVWTVGYGLFVVLVLTCAAVMRWAGTVSPPEAVAPVVAADEPITWARRARWCALAFAPSSLMLGVTTVLTTDIAPIPLLWVAPLALYLLTFMLAFGRNGAQSTTAADRYLPALLLGVGAAMIMRTQLQLVPALLLHLAPFLAAAMLCHGRLAADRPSPRHLTEFYFWLAFGGMAGGLFNTLAAPLLFTRIVEYPLALALVACLRPADPARGGRRAMDLWLPVAAAAFVGAALFAPWMFAPPTLIGGLLGCTGLALTRRHRPITVAAVAGAFLLASPWVTRPGEVVLQAERTFFGSYRVSLDREAGRRTLAHGTTLHGTQSVDPTRRREPLTYYHRTGPFGHMMESIPQLRQAGDVAAVGLGVGTLAAYATPGQQWTFYEIDPAIERIARDDRYFSFLKDCGAPCRVVLGDARLSLAAHTGARYQLIVLDAFSSDAIPVHLLTNDAMAVYLAQLAPHGVIAFHVSNRHLRLAGVVGRLAAANGLVALQESDFRLSRKEMREGKTWPDDKTASEWVVMARSRDDLGALTAARAWHAPVGASSAPLWTDDFSNILSVLQIRPY